MFTYCERQNIIQIALKGLPGGESDVKINFAALALPLNVVEELLRKCSYMRTVNSTSDYTILSNFTSRLSPLFTSLQSTDCIGNILQY
jgi:hypothetical protein